MKNEEASNEIPSVDAYPNKSTAPSDDQPSLDLQTSKYREQGSLWAWTRDLESTPNFTPNGRIIRGLECYQYASPTVDPVISQVELKAEELRNWLNARTPVQNDERPRGGYKILQFDLNMGVDVPMNREDYLAMNEAFCLPPISLHLSTKKQGASGMFVQDDDSVGNIILHALVIESNRTKFF